jgi:hypothetical protein
VKIVTMKWMLILFCLFNIYCLNAQIEFKIDNFSKDYYGKVNVADTNDVFVKGWVGLFDAKSNKELIHVESEELAFSFHSGKVLANIQELPYGEQSLIIYEDFNFDGKKDFAIENGQNSCYHGPSFVIYLANKYGFQFDPDFTELAQDYCGLFGVDKEKQQLNTMTKSGCCWHQYSVYNIVNNKPFAIKIIEEDYTKMPYAYNTIKTWNGKKMVESYEQILDTANSEIKLLFTFTIEENKKQVVLFKDMNGILNYCLLKRNGQVEFKYPNEEKYETSNFLYSRNVEGDMLSFTNNSATYIIKEPKQGAAKVEVQINNKWYVLKAIKSSAKGTLSNIDKHKLTNISNKGPK